MKFTQHNDRADEPRAEDQDDPIVPLLKAIEHIDDPETALWEAFRLAGIQDLPPLPSRHQ